MSEERDGVPVSVAWILVAALGAAILLTNWMRMPSSSEGAFPSTANGLPVVMVPDAIEVQQLNAGSDVAVAGWFEQSPPLRCDSPQPPVVELLNGNCTIDATWLMSEAEGLVDMTADGIRASPPSSPAVNVVFDGPDTSWAKPLPQRGRSVPTPVVFVGHFDDKRAAGCNVEALQRCLDRFVVTDVTWADGVDNP